MRMKLFSVIFILATMVATLTVGSTAQATVSVCAAKVNTEASTIQVTHLPGLSFVMVTVTLTDGIGPVCNRQVRLTTSRNTRSVQPDDIWSDTKKTGYDGIATFFVSPTVRGETTLRTVIEFPENREPIQYGGQEAYWPSAIEPWSLRATVSWDRLPGMRFEK